MSSSERGSNWTKKPQLTSAAPASAPPAAASSAVAHNPILFNAPSLSSFSTTMSSPSSMFGDVQTPSSSASPTSVTRSRKVVAKPKFSLGLEPSTPASATTTSAASSSAIPPLGRQSPAVMMNREGSTASTATPSTNVMNKKTTTAAIATSSIAPAAIKDEASLMGSQSGSSSSLASPSTAGGTHMGLPTPPSGSSGGAIPRPKRGVIKPPVGFNLLGGSDAAGSSSSSTPSPAATPSKQAAAAASIAAQVAAATSTEAAAKPATKTTITTTAASEASAAVAAAAASPAMMGSKTSSSCGTTKPSSPADPMPPTVSNSSGGLGSKPPARRVVKPKLPSMVMNLGISDDMGVVEMSKNTIKERDVEHLIVDCADSLDSPFIATTGQFPGGSGGPNPAMNPALSRYGQQQLSGPNSKAVHQQQQQNEESNKNSSFGGGGGGGGGGVGAKKFFRIDESNLFVFVNDRNDSSKEQSDLMRGGRNNNFSEMGRTGEASSGPGGGIGGIPFEQLKFGGILGSGQQGSVYAVSHGGKNYALKKISITDALDRGQAKIERQARKNGIVRELQMVANRDEVCQYVVNLHNAYFRKGATTGTTTATGSAAGAASSPSDADASSQQHLYILMERMSMSVEDLMKNAAKVSPDDVRRTAQRCFGDRISGVPVDGRKVERRTFRPNEYIVTAQRGTALPELVISVVAADALRGLHFLHTRLRLVHTDLKPANLMMSENVETVKIADFGCSQQLGSNGQVVVSNVILGTKLYMSPERARASFSLEDTVTFDEKADVWALGMLLLELATGCHPCDHFREEYWNFDKMLKWSNLAKPENMAADFFDFLRRALDVDPIARATTAELLGHDFIRRFERTNRKYLATFVRGLKTIAGEYELTRMRGQLRDHVKQKVTLQVDFAKKSQEFYKGITNKGVMGNVPDIASEDKFPSLGKL